MPWSTTGYADPGYQTISGRILDSAGNPAPNISIGLADRTNNNAAQVTTDSNGLYSVAVIAGNYQLFNVRDSVGWSYGPVTNQGFGPSYDATASDVTIPDIMLPQFTYLTTSVTDENNNPVGGVGVNFRLSSNQFLATDLSIGGTPINVINRYTDLVSGFSTYGTTTAFDGKAYFNVPIGQPFQAGTICISATNRTEPCTTTDIAVANGTMVGLESVRLITAAPTNLTIPSPTQAPSLSWDAVDGADYYRIYSNGNLVGTSSTNSYVDSTPTIGSDSYYVAAVNASGESAASNTVVVADNAISPSITSASSVTGNIRASFDFAITTTGYPSPTISESGALPNGITLTDNGDGTADLSGIPAIGSAPTYPITITADNGSGTQTTQSFILTITPNTGLPSFVSASSDTETFGVPFNIVVTTNGYPVPAITKTGALPTGVTMTDNGDGTAIIAGTPSTSAIGVYDLTFKAKSTFGTVTQSFKLTISKAPTITKIPGKTTTVGLATAIPIKSKGYTLPSLSATGLPSGLSLTDNADGNGTITGTPAVGTGGSYAVTITAANLIGTTSQIFTLKVNQAPAITSAAIVDASEGNGFDSSVTTSGFPIPSISKSGTLPKGVTFKASTGTFSGTPKTGSAGSYPITITAKNNTGTVTQNLTIVVSVPIAS